ncbi:recombination regulator RecX [Shewanella sp. A3A]|nr:recombination regulator RecX [Shewanella ferrihydritica]
MNILARCDKSCAALAQQLLQKGFDQVAVDEAVSWALELGYLDDQRLAEAILRSQLTKLHGPAKVEQALQLKGISKQLAAQVLNNTDVDWFALAEQRLQRKFANLAPAADFQAKQKQQAKIVRHLLGQGFNYEQANYALSSHLSELTSD